MTQKVVVWDDTAGKFVVSTSTIADLGGGSSPSPSIVQGFIPFKDMLFVGDDTQAVFQSLKDLKSSSLIDVMFNGRMVEENSDWTRNIATEQFTVIDDGGGNLNLATDLRMRIRIYSPSFSHTDLLFTGNGVTSDFSTGANDITDEDVIDVYINGRLMREDVDWERDSVADTIKTIDGSPGNPLPLANDARLRVRLNVSGDFAEQFFPGGANSVSTSCLFTTGDRIDLYINGRLTEEGRDWNRNVTTNAIEIVDGATKTNSQTQVRLRIW